MASLSAAAPFALPCAGGLFTGALGGAPGERPCAVGCVNQTLNAPPALLQEGVSPGPSDPDDAAIPWSIDSHPVKINTFATDLQHLKW